MTTTTMTTTTTKMTRKPATLRSTRSSSLYINTYNLKSDLIPVWWERRSWRPTTTSPTASSRTARCSPTSSRRTSPVIYQNLLLQSFALFDPIFGHPTLWIKPLSVSNAKLPLKQRLRLVQPNLNFKANRKCFILAWTFLLHFFDPSPHTLIVWKVCNRYLPYRRSP